MKGMKNICGNILSSVLLSLMLIAAPVVVTTGCQSTPQQIAYKSLKSVQQASVAALNIYGAAYKRGEVSAQKRAEVQELYVKYQAAFAAAAAAAHFNYDSPSTGELSALVGKLVEAVNTLRK